LEIKFWNLENKYAFKWLAIVVGRTLGLGLGLGLGQGKGKGKGKRMSEKQMCLIQWEPPMTTILVWRRRHLYHL
jgi:hypothetical protein